MADQNRNGTITITLNGEPRRVPGDLTVGGLLGHLELNERMVVVERNREIVRRGRYAELRVVEGDTIELVHFVGGG
jgi:thiamine biosynthesis protein ThiS